MKRCLLIVLLAQALSAQNSPLGKPCIAFSPESSSPTNELAKQPLHSLVSLSGDFDFYDTRHDGCWNIHVIALPVASKKGKPIGYAVSHTVTDVHDVEVGHALTFGPDHSIFIQAMNKAAGDAIRNIRLTLNQAATPNNQNSH